MLKNMITFHDLANEAMERSSASMNSDSSKLTYGVVKSRLGDLLYKLASQKFEDPAEGEAALKAKFGALNAEIRDRIAALEEEYR